MNEAMEMIYPILGNAGLHENDIAAPKNNESGASLILILSSVLGEFSLSGVSLWMGSLKQKVMT